LSEVPVMPVSDSSAPAACRVWYILTT